MATVVTVMNMKGGVGKTTVCAHLAGMLSLYEYKGRHRRVLAIDYDPQFNLSQMFIPQPTYFKLEDEGKTSLAILKDDETKVDPFVIQVPTNLTPPFADELAHTIYRRAKDRGSLDLIPSTLNLMYIALGQTTSRTSAFEERFTKFIDACRERYDVVLIDCHPAGSILTKTSLANSDHVLIPVLPSKFSLRGIELMRQFIGSTKKGEPRIPYHILFNHNGTRSSKKEEEVIRTNPRYAEHCLLQSLPEWKAYSDPREGRDFVWHSGKPYSTTAWRELDQVVTEVAERLHL